MRNHPPSSTRLALRRKETPCPRPPPNGCRSPCPTRWPRPATTSPAACWPPPAPTPPRWRRPSPPRKGWSPTTCRRRPSRSIRPPRRSGTACPGCRAGRARPPTGSQVNSLVGSGFDAMGWVPEGQRAGFMSYSTIVQGRRLRHHRRGGHRHLRGHQRRPRLRGHPGLHGHAPAHQDHAEGGDGAARRQRHAAARGATGAGHRRRLERAPRCRPRPTPSWSWR